MFLCRTAEGAKRLDEQMQKEAWEGAGGEGGGRLSLAGCWRPVGAFWSLLESSLRTLRLARIRRFLALGQAASQCYLYTALFVLCPSFDIQHCSQLFFSKGIRTEALCRCADRRDQQVSEYKEKRKKKEKKG
jgi:hypothetical protein